MSCIFLNCAERECEGKESFSKGFFVNHLVKTRKVWFRDWRTVTGHSLTKRLTMSN